MQRAIERAKIFSGAAALFLSLVLPLAAYAQYGYGPRAYPPPFAQQRPEMVLGTAHVDGAFDHDDIRVDRYAGRFHFVLLQVHDAPIRFDHVVIHYADGMAQTLPVSAFIPPSGTSQWIALPGGERRIHSLELWYARAQPGNPIRPEVELFGAP